MFGRLSRPPASKQGMPYCTAPGAHTGHRCINSCMSNSLGYSWLINWSPSNITEQQRAQPKPASQLCYTQLHGMEWTSILPSTRFYSQHSYLMTEDNDLECNTSLRHKQTHAAYTADCYYYFRILFNWPLFLESLVVRPGALWTTGADILQAGSSNQQCQSSEGNLQH